MKQAQEADAKFANIREEMVGLSVSRCTTCFQMHQGPRGWAQHASRMSRVAARRVPSQLRAFDGPRMHIFLSCEANKFLVALGVKNGVIDPQSGGMR